MKTLPGITGLEYCTKGIGVQTRDPIIQSPGYSQSCNGYSYCFNNPLKFADPFGFTAVATALDMAIELWNQTGEYGGYYGPSGPVSYSKTEAETLLWAFEYLADEIGIPYWRFGYRAYLSGFVSDSRGGTGFVLSLYNLPDLNWSFQINQKSNYYFILDPWDNYYSHQKPQGGGDSHVRSVGNVFSFSFDFAFGGGFGFELGIVTDNIGGVKLFISGNANIGYGLGAGFNLKEVNSNSGCAFIVDNYEGYSAGFLYGALIFGFEQTGDKPDWKYSGIFDWGHTYTQKGGGISILSAPKLGVWWTNTSTKIWP